MSAPMGGAAAGPRRLTPERLRAHIAALLDEDAPALSDADDPADLGLDSVRMMTLVARWRREGMDVSFVELAERRTLGEWWALLESRGRAGDSGDGGR